MPTTYPAILRDGALHWLGEPPAHALGNSEFRVSVTLLDEPNGAEPNGAAMAEALERLAALGGLKEFGDPVEWQRETRRDRPLPGREP